MCNYVPWRKKTPQFIPPQVSFAFPDAALHWCHTLTEIQPDLYPLEVRENLVLLLYGNHDFLLPCLYISSQTQVKDAQMNVGIFRIHPLKLQALLLSIISACKKRFRLSVYAIISANFVSEPSREEVGILKIIPEGIFTLACEGPAFGTKNKLPLNQQDCFQVCSWVG